MNPGDNHFRLNVIKTIEKYDMLSPHTSILVGFSGGADSVSLLHVLLSLKQKYQISVSAIHINHEIRGEEADRDELFCFDFCKKNGIKLFISRVNVPEYAAKNKMSLELAARELRYEEFAKILKNQKIDCVATAHTASDNAETVLLNLIRGYSIGGICGIPPKRDNIIRPLINLTRSEVIEYITLNNLNYITDSTNFSDEYTRNFIRNNIVPLCKKINPSFENGITRLSETAKCDFDYFAKNVLPINSKSICEQPFPLLSRAILSSYKKIDPSGFIDSNTIVKIFDAVAAKKSCSFDIKNGIVCQTKNGEFSFSKKMPSPKIVYNFGTTPLFIGDNTFFNDKLFIKISKPLKNFKQINNYSTTNGRVSVIISNGLVVRNKKNGDKIVLNGMTKSLKKEFINKKIPKEKRDLIPVLCYGDDIVFVPYIGVSDSYKLNCGDDYAEIVVCFS